MEGFRVFWGLKLVLGLRVAALRDFRCVFVLLLFAFGFRVKAKPEARKCHVFSVVAKLPELSNRLSV